MDNSNPLIRLSIYGRLKRMVSTYQGKRLETTDRRILRGLYLRKLRDYDEEIIEKQLNMSLL